LDDSPLGRGLLGRLTRASLHHPFVFLLVAAALFAAGVRLGLTLFGDIHSSFQELLPAKFASVRQINDLLARVGGDGTVLVVIESKDGRAGLPAAQAFAPVLVKDYLAMGPDVIRSIEWNRREVEAWYADHWPMFLSLEQLTEARDTLQREVRAAKRKANPLDLHLDDEAPSEAPAAGPRSPWLDPKTPLPREQVEKRFENFLDGFLVSADRASVTLMVRPTGTALGVDEARALVDRMRAVADSHRAELDRNHLRVGFGGTFPMFVAEYEALLHDVASTALLCLSLVLLSLFLFFRDVRSTLSLGIAVLTAVAVTFGITRLTIGYLNSQTAFLGAIVLGNGINYGLIYLARVRQLRRAGVGLEPAVLQGARAAWRATLLAAVATSVSFGVLTLADNRGFRHFGIIGGIGMLLCWAFTFALVPALLALFERIHPVKPSRGPLVSHPLVPRWVTGFFSHPAAVMAGFTVLLVTGSALFLRSLPTIIERDLTNLTNELRGHNQLIEDNTRAQNSLGRSVSGAVAMLQSPQEADAFCEVIRTRMKEPRYAPVLDGCETVSSVVPTDQEAKLVLIRDIARRLSDAVIDAQTKAQRPRLRQVRAELLAQAPLTLAQAPATLLDRFREKDGTVGRLAAVTARPDALLELAPRLNAFVESVRNVPVSGRLVDATGENVIFSDLLQDIDREGPRTTVLSFLGVSLLVLLFFRQVRMSVETLIQLLGGVVLMGGVAALMGLKINFFNFIVYPITFGIAVDYGANVILRAAERRGAVLPALVEVGPAVALCSWTTIIGYGSLVLSANRALRGFGWYALLGELCCVITALVLLPAMLLWAAARRRAAESVASQPVGGS
jgi:predicted RND superfamily exporter protein